MKSTTARADSFPGGTARDAHPFLHHRHLILPSKRQERRIRNRLRKRQITLKRFELGDAHLVTMRTITYRKNERRTTVFCMIDMGRSPRRIADAIIANHRSQ